MSARQEEHDSRQAFLAFSKLLIEAESFTWEQFTETAAQLDKEGQLYRLANATPFPERAESYITQLLQRANSTSAFMGR